MVQAAKANSGNSEALRNGIRAIAPPFVTAVVFSFFINLLLFVPALYMLQIYDRVLGTRNLVTLGGITVIAAFLLMVWAALETLRSRLREGWDACGGDRSDWGADSSELFRFAANLNFA